MNMKVKYKNTIQVLHSPYNWYFVEEFFPNYYSSEFINYFDDLHKTKNGEMEFSFLVEKWDLHLKKENLHQEMDRVRTEIYLQAYRTFISGLKNKEIELISD